MLKFVVRSILFACVVSATVSLYAIEQHLALAANSLALIAVDPGPQRGRPIVPASCEMIARR